jgi:hypothetical protein
MELVPIDQLPKKNKKTLQKTLDKPGNPCYTIITEGKEKEIKTMYKVYYFDQKKNRHECGEFDKPIPAMNEALACIFDSRWAKWAVVEKDGEIYRKYYA